MALIVILKIFLKIAYYALEDIPKIEMLSDISDYPFSIPGFRFFKRFNHLLENIFSKNMLIDVIAFKERTFVWF